MTSLYRLIDFVKYLPVVIVSTAMSLGFELAHAGSDTPPLPRYQLQKGQEIQFRGQSESQYTNGDHVEKFGDVTDWTFWVVRQNGDGSWRLLLRLNTKGWTQSDSDSKRSEQPIESKVCYFDLMPDGRIPSNDSLRDASVEPERLFPTLPPNSHAAINGWEADERDGLAHWKLATDLEHNARTALVIKQVSQTPADKIFLFTSTSTFRFDMQQGLIQRAESDFTQGWKINYSKKETLDRIAITDHDEQWLKGFADDCDRYCKGVRAYRDLLNGAGHDVDHAEKCTSESLMILKKLREQLKERVFGDQVEHDLANHKERVQSIIDEAKWVSELKSKPAAEWTVEGLDGRKHALSDYRGKVVVLDFWFKGCGWCMMSMPHIQQLADDVKDTPVAVLGMSVDPDEKDARSVVDTMHITYPVLKAADISLKVYHAEICPTLIVIDKHGIVRDVRVGYYQVLRADVTKTLKELLAEK